MKTHEENTTMGHYLSLSQAAAASPGHPHMGSVWRWCRRGIRSRSGERIKLQHVRAGGKIYTTEAWLDAFFAATAAADASYFDAEPTPQPKHPSDAQRKRSIEAADAVLRSAGIV